MGLTLQDLLQTSTCKIKLALGQQFREFAQLFGEQLSIPAGVGGDFVVSESQGAFFRITEV
jgi:hypothetical protein